MDARKKENDTDLLDLLIVMAENIRLLILVPLIVGLLVLGAGFAVPKSYVSQAALSMPMLAITSGSTPMSTPPITPALAASMMVSPQVLDAVVASLDLSDKRSVEAAREKLVSQVKVTASKDGLLRLDVTASIPTQAQAIANALVDSWLKTTPPSGQERAILEKRLAHATAALDSVNRIMARLAAGEVQAQQKSGRTRELATSLMAVSDLQARYLGEVLAITRQLKGLSRDDVLKQAPTLPVEPVAPKKAMMAVLGMLTSGFVVLMWVFMRHAWRNVAQDPQAAQKLARLRAALGFK